MEAVLKAIKAEIALRINPHDISLFADGWTLIDHSAHSAFSIDNANFIASDGTNYSWANAVSQNKVYAYLAYWDSTAALAKDRKYKYSSLSTLGVDDSNLQPKTGYWVYATEAGKLNLPAVGGTLATETFAWNKIRFHNGTDELNASQAVTAGWAHSAWNYTYIPGILGRPGSWTLNAITDYNTFTLNPWQGYFIKSDYDNVTLIRQN